MVAYTSVPFRYWNWIHNGIQELRGYSLALFIELIKFLLMEVYIYSMSYRSTTTVVSRGRMKESAITKWTLIWLIDSRIGVESSKCMWEPKSSTRSVYYYYYKAYYCDESSVKVWQTKRLKIFFARDEENTLSHFWKRRRSIKEEYCVTRIIHLHTIKSEDA